jgi:hypothetical protein
MMVFILICLKLTRHFSIAVIVVTSCDAEENLRRKLAFFFMDPVRKFIARRQVDLSHVLLRLRLNATSIFNVVQKSLFE